MNKGNTLTKEIFNKTIERLNQNKKLEKVWNCFKMARRIAKRNGKRLSIEVFNKMVEDELGKDWVGNGR